MGTYEFSPTAPLSSLSSTAQGVFLSARGRQNRLSQQHPAAVAAIDELVAAGYALLVRDRQSKSDHVVEMAELHDDFSTPVGTGSQDVTVEIMPPEEPDYGGGQLLAVLTGCDFNIVAGKPWQIATITAVDGELTDDEGDRIRVASIRIAQPLLILTFGAYQQVWLGTLVKACLYPADVDVAVASLRGRPEFRDRQYLPPEIPSVSPSVVRVTVKPTKSLLSKQDGS